MRGKLHKNNFVRILRYPNVNLALISGKLQKEVFPF